MNISEFTGTDAGFEYKWLSQLSDEDKLRKYCSSLRRRYRKHAATSGAHEEWFIRTYCAVKYILAATALLSAAGYSREKGVRIALPYLQYYALFNTSRALILLMPEQQWNDGNLLLTVQHSKASNLVGDVLRCVSVELKSEFCRILDQSLALREFFSYRFPAEGPAGSLEAYSWRLEDIIRVCSGVAEVAQLLSECLDSAFAKQAVPVELDTTKLWPGMEYSARTITGVIDSQDHYRLSRLITKYSSPCTLSGLATEGLVEDFLGAWYDDDVGGADGYRLSPREYSLIFPFC